MRDLFAPRTLALVVAGASALALAGCGGGNALNRARPDEFAVTRNAPLVVPPDFALVPPRPGAPRPQEADSSTQALQTMFGGQAQRSGVEASVARQAGAPMVDAGARSAVDPATNVVDKGSVTREIVAAPAGQGQDASVTPPR